MQIRKATRQKAKIRLGLSAVSGGGKTYSALLIAFGLCGDWNKITVIDTENNSADLYSHLGEYNVIPLPPPYNPERYIEAIHACEDAGMEVIIIDSISHEWEGEGGILNMTDVIGGGFSDAWKKLTPRHEKFKHAILQSKCHIITTVRRKTEYVLEEYTNKQGRTVQKPVKVGLKEVTRESWEYELTVNLELDLKHNATSSKDRTGLFLDKDPFKPSIETGKMIANWCESGIEVIKEKPGIAEGAFTKAIDRIQSGETVLFDKINATYQLTPEQSNTLISVYEAAKN
jgi:hypothetical protein